MSIHEKIPMGDLQREKGAKQGNAEPAVQSGRDVPGFFSSEAEESALSFSNPDALPADHVAKENKEIAELKKKLAEKDVEHRAALANQQARHEEKIKTLQQAQSESEQNDFIEPTSPSLPNRLPAEESSLKYSNPDALPKKVKTKEQVMANHILLLSDSDCESALSMAQCIEMQRLAFKALATEKAVVPSRIMIPIPEHDGASLFKPAYVPISKHGDPTSKKVANGLKVVNVRPHNAEIGLPTVPATISLFDNKTGMLKSIMGGTFLTAQRTAAGSGLATRCLLGRRADDVKKMVVFGAGMQGEQHIRAMMEVCDEIEVVVIFNRNVQRALNLQQKMAAVFPSIKFWECLPLPHPSIEDHVGTADLICCCTNSSTPLFTGHNLKPGCHINGVGSYTPSMQEVPEAAVQRALVVPDTEEALSVGDLSIPRGSNRSRAEKYSYSATLGELVLLAEHDDSPAARSLTLPILPKIDGRDITFFKSVGTAVQDMATAHAVYENACNMSLGTFFSFD